MIRRPPFLNNHISMTGSASAPLALAKSRLIFLPAFFILCFGLVGLRLFDIAVLNAPAKGEKSEDIFAFTDKTIETGRGKILDRNGVLLAANIPMLSLYADPYLIRDPKAVAEQLVEIFPDLSYGKTLQQLQSKGRFAWIKRNISPASYKKILHLGEPGLAVKHNEKRVYPQGPLAAHLVGYTNVDRQGLAGLEAGFNTLLDQGEDIQTTLDIRLQHLLHKEISRAMDDFTAKAGAGVIMDVKTGEILAGVSLPDFNPHHVTDTSSSTLFNRLTLGVYELGSMFKIFSTAALLEYHSSDLNQEFDVREPIKIGRFQIRDYHPENRILTVPEVFMYSSNIGSAKMGEIVGTDLLRQFYDRLGLLSPLQFEIREVGRPLLPSPWRDINTLTASYGHGIATSPLQMSAAVASIVNNGLEVKPTLIKHDEHHQKIKYTNRIVSENTSHIIRKLLRLTVTEGTGGNADVAGLDIGGKTGTAEKISASGGYDHKKLISSFVGTFPSHDPQYIIMVMVDEPHGNKQSYGYATAGWVAAPAIANIASQMAVLLGITPASGGLQQDYSADIKQYVHLEKKGESL